MKRLVTTAFVISTSAVLLSACADTAVRRDAPEAASAPAATRAEPRPARAPTPPAPATAPAPIVDAVHPTGIEECDAYLQRYIGCHHVIGTYPVDELDDRYERTRAMLIERAHNQPAGQLAETCASLAAIVDEALDDRECATPESLGTVVDIGFEDEE